MTATADIDHASSHDHIWSKYLSWEILIHFKGLLHLLCTNIIIANKKIAVQPVKAC